MIAGHEAPAPAPSAVGGGGRVRLKLQIAEIKGSVSAGYLSSYHWKALLIRGAARVGRGAEVRSLVAELDVDAAVGQASGLPLADHLTVPMNNGYDKVRKPERAAGDPCSPASLSPSPLFRNLGDRTWPASSACRPSRRDA